MRLLTSDYFEHQKKDGKIFELWKKGFSFDIEAIKEKLELRRNWVIDDIKSRLEKQHRLLLVGVSGTSKSTTLMEIACDYVDKNYLVLYGTDEIRNIETLIRFIEGLLKGNKKVLVAVDNVHNAKTASIFYVIDRLSKYERGDDLFFILTARLPDFDHFIKDFPNEITYECRNSIEKITDQEIFPEFRYQLPPFSKEDVRAFIEKYGEPKILNEFKKLLGPDSMDEVSSELSEEQLIGISDMIHKSTNGSALMIKFYVLRQSLSKDVKDKYIDYLRGYPNRIKTMLICSMLEYVDFPITDNLMTNTGLLKSAWELNQVALQQHAGVWNTIHREWSRALLDFMLSHDDMSTFLGNRQYLKDAVSEVIKARDESALVSIVDGVYITFSSTLFFKDFEFVLAPIFDNMPNYLSQQAKSKIYEKSGEAHLHFITDEKNERLFDKALERYNEALSITPKSSRLLYKKAIVYSKLKEYDAYMNYLDKAIEANNRNFNARTLKAKEFERRGQFEEALDCYNTSFEIAPNALHYGWANAIHLLLKLNRFDEAVEILEREANLWAEKGYYERALRNYDKIAEIQPNDSRGLHLKADLLRDMENYEDALVCYDEALKINADDSELLVSKGIALTQNGQFGDAIDCFDRAIELTPFQDYPYAWYQKGLSLDTAGDRQEADKNFDKALELINYRLQDDIGQKIVMLYQLKRYAQTIEACNELLKLDPKNGWCWDIKGESQFCLRKFDEAIKSYSEAIDTFDEDSKSSSNYIETVYCRARAYASINDEANSLADLQIVMDFNLEQGLERIEKDEAFNSLKNHESFKKMVSRCSKKNWSS